MGGQSASTSLGVSTSLGASTSLGVSTSMRDRRSETPTITDRVSGCNIAVAEFAAGLS